MTTIAYPNRPITNLDKPWWISFIAANGHCKPNGMMGMQWVSYRVVASSRPEALDVLRASNHRDWDWRCTALIDLQKGADIRICDFDLVRRMVLCFDPTGLDPEGHHYYAIVFECPTDGEIEIPIRGEASWAREQASRTQDAIFQEHLGISTATIDDLPDELRFHIRVRRGCWRWQGSVSYSGYGQVRYEGRQWAVHRLVYTLLKGDIPGGAILRHLCHCANCCNPDHLIPGTHFSNHMDERLKMSVRRLLRQPRLSADERLSQLYILYGLESRGLKAT